MMFSLSSPWCLLTLLILPLCRLYGHWRKRRRASVSYSSVGVVRTAGRTWRVRSRWLPEVCLEAGFAALAVALARPQSHVTTSQTDNASEGIAIEMVLDRSASMCQPMAFENRRTTRLEAVKGIFSLFVFGDAEHGVFKGRQGDLVGLVSFAKTAETNCPLTLGHEALTDALEGIVLLDPADTVQVQNAARAGLDLNAVLIPTGEQQLYRAFALVYGKENAEAAFRNYRELEENNRTAIGDALALGLARLKQIDANRYTSTGDITHANSYKIQSKVLILLTDGENNHGREVGSVIAYARDAGIKVHVIAIGEARFLRGESDLPRLAKETGGTFTVADSAEELVSVYREIDAMERSRLTDVTYTNTTEFFQPFLLGGLALLLLGVVLLNTLYRTLP